jgi:hypothetical protein
MHTRKHPLTPLAAVAAGLLAGAVGPSAWTPFSTCGTVVRAAPRAPWPGNSRRSAPGRRLLTQGRPPAA